MNRPVVGPQSLRGIPGGFASQQQVLGQPRSSSSRLPNGKLASNGATWGFGGVPLGGSGLPNPRQSNGLATSFAQTMGSSQPATSLDLSEFPSLSNNPSQQISTSTWATGNARTLGQPSSQRSQQQAILAMQQQTQQQHEDLFSSSSQISGSQSTFRFGGATNSGQSSSAQNNRADDFPPLSHESSETSQERSMNVLQSVGFGGQSSGLGFGSGLGSSQGSRSNGLLSALSSSNRATSSGSHGSTSTGLPSATLSRSPLESSNPSQSAHADAESPGFGRLPHQDFSSLSSQRDQGASQVSSNLDSIARVEQAASPAQPQSNGYGNESPEDPVTEPSPEVEDPLVGMNDKDRFALKGLLATMNGPYPDQAALITGIDINSLGFDLSSNKRFSEMLWSPFDDAPPRQPPPEYTTPDCYIVQNVQPVENKISSLSDDTLMFIFYTKPNDMQQIVAAHELTNRNWRYHKTLRMWLTKDEMMVPQQMGATSERGYYIFFDPQIWRRERREFVLVYDELEVNGPAF